MNRNERSERPKFFWLPNVFTTVALFCGFFAVIAAMSHKFEHAVLAVFGAILFDGLDGRIARLTRTQSDFGAQYDSLSDLVSFGVAPALVSYQWALISWGKLGWLVPFVYCVAAAMRLARFNSRLAVTDSSRFEGLPSPAAAALVIGFIWLSADYRFKHGDVVLMLLLLLAAFTMVSQVPYLSFKDTRRRSFIGLFLSAVLLALIALNPPLVLFVLFVAYVLSGYGLWLKRYWQNRHTPLVD